MPKSNNTLKRVDIVKIQSDLTQASEGYLFPSLSGHQDFFSTIPDNRLMSIGCALVWLATGKNYDLALDPEEGGNLHLNFDELFEDWVSRSIEQNEWASFPEVFSEALEAFTDKRRFSFVNLRRLFSHANLSNPSKQFLKTTDLFHLLTGDIAEFFLIKGIKTWGFNTSTKQYEEINPLLYMRPYELNILNDSIIFSALNKTKFEHVSIATNSLIGAFKKPFYATGGDFAFISRRKKSRYVLEKVIAEIKKRYPDADYPKSADKNFINLIGVGSKETVRQALIELNKKTKIS